MRRAVYSQTHLQRFLKSWVRLLSRMKARGWRGESLGFRNVFRTKREGRLWSIATYTDLHRGDLDLIVQVSPAQGLRKSVVSAFRRSGFYRRLDATFRRLGYRPYWFGAEGQRGYHKTVLRVAAIDEEWESIRQFAQASGSGKPVPSRGRKKASRSGAGRLFTDLVRWYADARQRGWKIAGGEISQERGMTSCGHRWETRKDLMFNNREVCAAFFAWPKAPFRAPDRKRLEALGFYRRADSELAKFGLLGRWGPMSAARPNELSADHWNRRLPPSKLPGLCRALSDWQLPNLP